MGKINQERERGDRMSRLTEKNKFDTHYGISISKNLLQSAYDKLGKLEDLLQSYNIKDLEELNKLLEMVKTCKEFSKQLGFPLPLLKKVLDNGIWVKDKDRFYHLDTLEINVKIEDDGFVIEELYFEDLDCVMDTTGFKVYSKDYKKTWFLKEDKSE